MKRSPIPVIVIVVVLLFGIAMLNKWQGSGQSSDSNSSQQQKPPAQSAAAPSPPIGPTAAGNLPGELVIGNPSKAATRITVGYTYDDATMKNPDNLTHTVQGLQMALRTAPPNVSLQLVCVDLPKDQLTNPAVANVPLGVTINGKQPPALATNPGEGRATMNTIMQVVGSQVMSHHP